MEFQKNRFIDQKPTKLIKGTDPFVQRNRFELSRDLVKNGNKNSRDDTIQKKENNKIEQLRNQPSIFKNLRK